MSKSVVPPTPIINRNTGAATQFGPRRAYDGFYVLELLRATGCTGQEAATMAKVLQPLLQNCGRLTVEKLLGTLRLYPRDDPQYFIDDDGGRPTIVRAIDDGVVTYLNFGTPKKDDNK